MLIWMFLLYSEANEAVPLEPLEDNCVADQIAGEARVQRSGQQVYKEICAACHGPAGAGLASTFPPLKGSEWIEDPELIAQIVLRGLAGKLYVQGVRYASAMPSFADQLSDAELAGVVSYVQQSFAVSQVGISKGRVTELRALTAELPSISGQKGLENLVRIPVPTTEKQGGKSWFLGCASAD